MKGAFYYPNERGKMFYHMEWALLLGVLILLPFILLMTVYKKSSDYGISDAILASFVSVIVCFFVFSSGVDDLVNDVEVLSGEVINKKRQHDSYTESYSCGEKTCYRTIYRVQWILVTNVGEKTLKTEKSQFRTVYSKEDPDYYKAIVIGEPAALENTFRNYVKASPRSLFGSRLVDDAYKGVIKPYPVVVYNYYKADRVILMGGVNQDKKEWNSLLSDRHKEWGVKRKVNVMLVFVDEKDANIAISIKNHWVQGKQNDLIVVFGMDKDNKTEIAWTDVFGWNEDELMKIKLKNDLTELKTIENKQAVLDVVDSYLPQFKYRNMEKDFKYLERNLKPHWVWLIFALVGSFFASVIAIAWKQKHFNHRFSSRRY